MFQTFKTLARMFQSDDVSPARRPQTTLGVHTLEAREVPAVLASVVNDGAATVLKLQGDNAGTAESVTITSNGVGGITLTGDVAGSSNRQFTGIDRVEAYLGGGNDVVTFNQGTATAPVTQTRSLSVKVNLEDGSDRFTANLHGTLTSHHTLALEANGDALFGGNDVLQVNAGAGGGDFNVQQTGVFKVKMTGGGGADTLGLNYVGVLRGVAVLDMSGGDGNDILNVSAVTGANSIGQLQGENDIFGNTTPASIRGDGGSDRVNFNFDRGTGSTATSFVSLDGGLFDNDVLSVNHRDGSTIQISNFEQFL